MRMGVVAAIRERASRRSRLRKQHDPA